VEDTHWLERTFDRSAKVELAQSRSPRAWTDPANVSRDVKKQTTEVLTLIDDLLAEGVYRGRSRLAVVNSYRDHPYLRLVRVHPP